MKNIKTYSFFIIAILIAVATVYFSYANGLFRFTDPSTADYPVRGLDVSHHQGEIDWPRVPGDQFSFVYIKATEGGDFRDTKFDMNWAGAQAAGLKTGAYHFFTLCRPGADQAKNFIEVVPPAANAMPPAIDLEYVGNCKARPSRADFIRELDVFVEAVQRHYKQKPVLYVTEHFFDDYLSGTDYADFPLWVRGIFAEPSRDKFPAMIIWQYADNARVPGIAGPVDLNAAIQTP